MTRTPKTGHCPYCLSDITPDEDRVRCPKCGVVHHADCWKANGKCSVYGCDGWVLWNESLTERLAPEASPDVDVTTEDTGDGGRPEDRCITCGAPVRRGRMHCFNCMRHSQRYFFENCFGPSVVIFCAVAGGIAWVVRALLT